MRACPWEFTAGDTPAARITDPNGRLAEPSSLQGCLSRAGSPLRKETLRRQFRPAGAGPASVCTLMHTLHTVVWQELGKPKLNTQLTQVQILAVPLTDCVPLGKLLSLSVPQFLYLYYGDNNKTSLFRLE